MVMITRRREKSKGMRQLQFDILEQPVERSGNGSVMDAQHACARADHFELRIDASGTMNLH
jgi:hypothetical protein